MLGSQECSFVLPQNMPWKQSCRACPHSLRETSGGEEGLAVCYQMSSFLVVAGERAKNDIDVLATGNIPNVNNECSRVVWAIVSLWRCTTVSQLQLIRLSGSCSGYCIIDDLLTKDPIAHCSKCASTQTLNLDSNPLPTKPLRYWWVDSSFLGYM